MDWSFLKSTRWWALVIGAVSVYAQLKGWIGEAEMALIATITGGFITVRTVDRISDVSADAKVESAEIASK